MSSQQENSKVAIVITAITAIGGLGVAFLNNWIEIFPEQNPNENELNSPSDSQQITVHFDVRTSDEAPVSGAEIRFVFEGAPISKYTDKNGYTSIQLPKRDDVEVVLSKQDFVTQRININLLVESGRVRTIYLEKSASSSSNGDKILGSEPGQPEKVAHSSEVSIDLESAGKAVPEQNIPQDLVFRSETNKTRLTGLEQACFGRTRIEPVETVFGYNKPPFTGNIQIPEPSENGCLPGDILRGNFELSGNGGRCTGDVVITLKEPSKFLIEWTINNLGSSCSVGNRDWEILVYPES